ncbi:MAG: RES family NAD+ phosphorylase [Balneolaceae bacterium]
MHTRVWRICHEQYQDSAFSGEGARKYGGRFNTEGNSAVYTSGFLSLALLEMLVQVNKRSILSNFVMISADIPEHFIYSPDESVLPEKWNQIPYEKESQLFGDKWLAAPDAAPVLKIPSVVVPTEFNYVINPLHSAVKDWTYSSPENLPFDRRLK